MNYQSWELEVSPAFKGDALWKVQAYPLSRITHHI